MASRNLSRVSAPAPTAITGPGRTGPAPGGTPGWASGLHRPPPWLPRPSHGHSLSTPSRPFSLILGSEACRGGLPGTGSARTRPSSGLRPPSPTTKPPGQGAFCPSSPGPTPAQDLPPSTQRCSRGRRPPSEFFVKIFTEKEKIYSVVFVVTKHKMGLFLKDGFRNLTCQERTATVQHHAKCFLPIISLILSCCGVGSNSTHFTDGETKQQTPSAQLRPPRTHPRGSHSHTTDGRTSVVGPQCQPAQPVFTIQGPPLAPEPKG